VLLADSGNRVADASAADDMHIEWMSSATFTDSTAR